MALPGKPLVWSPRGASDTLDSSTAPKGAMGALTNLIPDPTTRDLWQCRPAAISLANFVGANRPWSAAFSSAFGPDLFVGPTFVSVYRVYGTWVYGMVSTSRNPGHDEPFAYNILTGLYTAISGVTAVNTPISPQTAGPWSPPSMALVGSTIIFSHPGFTGAGNAYFGVLDITNPAAPAWSAQNTTTNTLIAPPTWVFNFNGRCYFLVNPPNQMPAAYFSDPLTPTIITNANQILTFGDNVPLTGAGGVPLDNQLGGVLQSMMVFKGVTNIYQITGDYALQNLSLNALNPGTGTYAANTIVSTPKGLAFVAPDGVRVIDFGANVGDPIGVDGDGIAAPFVSALTPSRMCAAYNNGIYRVQLQNGGASGNPQQQWWYDFVRTIWSGPHTQAASLMAAYANSFIVALQGTAALFQSDTAQSSSTTYVENGVAMNFNWATPMLPDTDQMAEVAMVETTLHMALVAGNTITVTSQDQNGVVLDTVTVVPAGSATLWGAFIWDQALWQGVANALYPRPLQWHFPIVFRRMAIVATGVCASGIKIGRLHLRYEVLGYLQQ